MTYYDTLGVPRTATPDEIRTAYRALVMLFHPDRIQQLNPAMRAFAEERLKALNEAYDVLSDTDKRAAYDRQLVASTPRPAAPRSAPPEPPPPPAPQPPPRSRPPEAGAYETERQQQAWLNEQIAELELTLRRLNAERDRMHALLQGQAVRIQRRFWTLAGLTGVGSWSVLAAALGIFELPPAVVSPQAQLAAFALLAALYQYGAAMLITRACLLPGVPFSPLAVGRGWAAGLLGTAAAGLAGWAVWRIIFYEVTTLASLVALAVVFLLVHLAFCWAGLGRLTRWPGERRRQYDQANAPVLRVYRTQLDVLHARRLAMRNDHTP